MIDESSRITGTVQVDDTARIGPHCYLDGNIAVEGGAVLVGGITLIGDIHIGVRATLEPGVCIASSGPDEAGAMVKVGTGAHLGAGAILHSGVTIGQHAWVAAGTVVSRHVPPHAVVSGNPAVITGYLRATRDAAGEAPVGMVRMGPEGTHSSEVEGVKVFQLPVVRDLRGDLTIGEFGRTVPFEPKRYFVVHNVPSAETRGEHAHKRCHQFLTCVAGSVSVVVDDGRRREEILLDRPGLGLLIPAGIWGIQYKYSTNSALLVLASEYYDATDYIRDYSEFLRFREARA